MTTLLLIRLLTCAPTSPLTYCHPPSPPLLAGTYRVLKLLGAGAEGEAYLVDDEEGKSWALKLIKLPLPKGCLQSIVREIQLQSELGEGHNNIIGAAPMSRSVGVGGGRGSDVSDSKSADTSPSPPLPGTGTKVMVPSPPSPKPYPPPHQVPRRWCSCHTTSAWSWSGRPAATSPISSLGACKGKMQSALQRGLRVRAASRDPEFQPLYFLPLPSTPPDPNSPHPPLPSENPTHPAPPQQVHGVQ